jgi:hypothetical protein
MLRTMAEPLGEVCSVTRRLLRSGLELQTSRCVNVFFPAKGRMLFEQYTKYYIITKPLKYLLSFKFRSFCPYFSKTDHTVDLARSKVLQTLNWYPPHI